MCFVKISTETKKREKGGVSHRGGGKGGPQEDGEEGSQVTMTYSLRGQLSTAEQWDLRQIHGELPLLSLLQMYLIFKLRIGCLNETRTFNMS